jgi:O-glycosyl hydrolase
VIGLLLSMVGSYALEELDLSYWRQGFGKPQLNASISRTPLRVAGELFSKGVGAHAPGGAAFGLDGTADSISGRVGMNDSGGGSSECFILGDGKVLWRSGRLLHQKPAIPFSVSLKGVKVVTLEMSDAGDGDGGDHVNWLGVHINHIGTKPTPHPYMKTLTIHPDQPRQTMSNFAASDSWTVEHLMRWPEARRNEIARLLFDQKTGIGLSGWRHNLGGGLCPESITMDFRTVDTYETSEGKYDWSKIPGQRWMLRAAKEYRVPYLVAYAVTPPRRLTRNGLTNGTDGEGSTNLKDGAESAFAQYLVDILKHYLDEGYSFTHVSPINEPDFEWNGRPTPGSQEGSRASNSDVMRMGTALHQELTNRKLPVRVLTPEASSPQVSYGANQGMTKKYGSEYGAYAQLFERETLWRKKVNPVFGYHSYWAEKLEEMTAKRKQLGEELAKIPGQEVWMTEFCQLQGPNGEGGHGRDLGMTFAINTARLMQLDLTLVNASAWQWWLAVSDANFKDGLIYVDDLDKPDGKVFASKALWAMGNFSRFIRPGFQKIATEGPFENVSETLVSAFKDPMSGRIVVVFVNPATSTEAITLNLPGRWRRSAWITSDDAKESLSRMRIPASGANVSIPSRSVVTLILDPVKL